MATIGLRICLSFAIGCASLLAAAGVAQAAVDISSKPTKNMSCSAGVCSPTAKKGILNANDLVNLLQASDVKITTGSGAITIEVTASFSWVTPSRLTLDASYNVSIKAPIAVAGNGALTITSSDGIGGGQLLFFPGGTIDFWDLSSSLIVNGKSYVLVNDIEQLAANANGNVALARDYNASLDGTYLAPPISGIGDATLEGLGHAIANFSIRNKTGAAVGLIGSLGSNGIVRDIGIANADIVALDGNTLDYLYGGALVGQNHGTVLNAYATGKLKGGNATFLGGLVGYNNGTVANSFADVYMRGDSFGTVNGYVANGGLVGRNDMDGVVLSSYARGVMAGKDSENVGGLVGENQGQISHSWSIGRVLASKGRGTGGLVGLNLGSISDSYSSAEVNGRDASDVGGGGVGGLVGVNDPGAYGTADIERSFATGTVRGAQNSCLGGLVGVSDGGSILNSYSRAAVRLGDTAYGTSGGMVCSNAGSIGYSYSTGVVALGNGGYRGGLIGGDDSSSDLLDTYWDLNTSGIGDPSRGAGNIANDPGIVGLTDAQLKSGLPDGFDPAVWGQSATINGGYPYLRANPPPN
ncbi:MAG TPA: GLUG motif-containing protein [Rhizomicrobium sp.]|jgi:hypothetical protein